jgi:hypothetical protein
MSVKSISNKDLYLGSTNNTCFKHEVTLEASGDISPLLLLLVFVRLLCVRGFLEVLFPMGDIIYNKIWDLFPCPHV